MGRGPVHPIFTTNTINQCIILSTLIGLKYNLYITKYWPNGHKNERMYHLEYAIVYYLLGTKYVVLPCTGHIG